jgi:hypothetical protein
MTLVIFSLNISILLFWFDRTGTLHQEPTWSEAKILLVRKQIPAQISDFIVYEKMWNFKGGCKKQSYTKHADFMEVSRERIIHRGG